MQREGRRVDIREIPDLDDCGDNFMGVYICQNWSNCIIKFLTFFLKIKVYLIKNVASISAVYQSDRVSGWCVCVCVCV